MSRSSLDPRRSLPLCALTGLALLLPACIITGLPGDDDSSGDTEGPGDDSGSGGAQDESGEDDGVDETGADDDGTGDTADTGEENSCDPAEQSAHVYQHDGSTDGEHWSLGIHRVSGTFSVYGPLSVDPCSIIEMGDGARIHVGSGGSLQWSGAPGEPIVVTSTKASPAPGDWDHIRVSADSVGPDNVLEHVRIEYGGGSSYYGALHLQDGASLEMHDGSVRHSAGMGMVVDGDAELRGFVGNRLSDNADGALMIAPDHAGDLLEGTYAPNGVEGIHLAGTAVAHDQSWLAHDAPYVASSGFSVGTEVGSARLTVQAGAEIRMGDAADIRVGNLGGLTLEGTEEAPIVIRSAKSTGAPGDWDEIRIADPSVDAYNSFSHVRIEHGGGSYYGAVWVQSGASLSMHDSTIREAGDFGLMVDNGAELRDFSGNSLIDNDGAALSIGAGEVDDLGEGTYGPNGIDGIIVRNGTVDHDAQWLAHGVPLIADAGFAVDTDVGSAVLTLDAGVRIELGDAGDIRVLDNGGLLADGSPEQHVEITSAKGSPAAGDWDEIRFGGGSLDAANLLRYTDISYGGGSYYGMLWVQSGTSVALDHVTFTAPGGGCDIVRDGSVDAVATSFVECP